MKTAMMTMVMSFVLTSTTYGLTEPRTATKPATNVKTTSVDLNGRLTEDGGYNCQVRFMYRKVGNVFTTKTTDWMGSLREGQSFSKTVAGLDPGTQYEYCCQGRYALMPFVYITGDWSSYTGFATPSILPMVITQPATNVGTTSATLNGRLTEDRDHSCEVRFRYRKVGSMFWTETTNWGGSLREGQGFGKAVTSLSSGTEYEYQCQARYSLVPFVYITGDWSSSTKFKTPTPDPVVVTLSATDLKPTSATLNGRLTKDWGHSCQTRFRYRKVGTSVWELTTDWAGSFREGQSFGREVAALDPATQYEYQCQARYHVVLTMYHEGYWSSAVRFTTPPRADDDPVVIVLAASNVQKTYATMNGRLTEDRGHACEYRFRHRKVGSSSWTETEWTGSIHEGQSFSAALGNLLADTRYEYQCQARYTTFLVIHHVSAWSSSIEFRTQTAGVTTKAVPNVVGMLQSAAESTLRAAGFQVGSISSAASNQPKGTVLSQNPSGGTSKPAGTPVNLTLSQGPNEPPSTELLVDSDFSASADSTVLRANGAGQDWYESRQDVPTLLTLDSTSVGGNAMKKAKLTASASGNAYLTQEFGTPQTQRFTAQWDIYVAAILNLSAAPDRGAWMLIGDDTGTDPARIGPNAEDGERFVYLGFSKNGGGSSGTMDLVARDRDDSWSDFTTVASNLNMRQWYTIQVFLDLVAGTYDVYVDGEYKATVTSRHPKSSVTHISFAQWNDGAGSFYVDNVSAESSAGQEGQTTERLALSYYVDARATGANDGSSWGDAFASLQDALEVAEDGDQVLVAQGVYEPDQGQSRTIGDREASFELSSGITVLGGFPSGGGTLEDRDPMLYETILSGEIGEDGNNADNSLHVVIASGGDDRTMLDGFTIMAGNADGNDLQGLGGGLYNVGGGVTVANCLFTANTAVSAAGAFNQASRPTFINCRFIANVAQQEGGGLLNLASNARMINCVLAANAADWGAGMSNAGASDLTITNCTFAWNEAYSTGGAVENDDQVLLRLTNSILWDNTAAEAGSQISLLNGSRLEIGFCCVQDGEAGVRLQDSTMDWRAGNITSDPLFEGGDGVEDGLGLSFGSPCLNSGDNARIMADLSSLGTDGDLPEYAIRDAVGGLRFVGNTLRPNAGLAVCEDSLPPVDMGALEAVK